MFPPKTDGLYTLQLIFILTIPQTYGIFLLLPLPHCRNQNAGLLSEYILQLIFILTVTSIYGIISLAGSLSPFCIVIVTHYPRQFEPTSLINLTCAHISIASLPLASSQDHHVQASPFVTH
jgi:hypothetical protein